MTDRQRWRPILFNCPRTASKIQVLLADETTVGGTYVTVSCLACSGVHLIDATDGKVLGAVSDGTR